MYEQTALQVPFLWQKWTKLLCLLGRWVFFTALFCLGDALLLCTMNLTFSQWWTGTIDAMHSSVCLYWDIPQYERLICMSGSSLYYYHEFHANRCEEFQTFDWHIVSHFYSVLQCVAVCTDIRRREFFWLLYSCIYTYLHIHLHRHIQILV